MDQQSSYSTISSARPKPRAGRTKFREMRHPLYKGVRQRYTDRWVCEVREPNKKTRIWLGTFPTAETAARAHDVAAIALRGGSACLNFADSAWLLPVPESSSAKDIQKATAKIVELFATDTDTDTANVNAASWSMEDALFGMDGYYEMADGMLIDYPHITETECYVTEEIPLWSYSI